LSGVNIVRRSLEEPIRQIAGNAGHEGSIVVDKVLSNNSPSWGFNAQTEKYEDLLAAGVIDPAKVARCALLNAASVASLMLMTETLIVERPKRESSAPMGGGAPGGMSGYKSSILALNSSVFWIVWVVVVLVNKVGTLVVR